MCLLYYQSLPCHCDLHTVALYPRAHEKDKSTLNDNAFRQWVASAIFLFEEPLVLSRSTVTV